MTDKLLKPDREKLDEALNFIAGFSSVVLGSVSKSGQPHTSYAPYITDQGNFYIYVSALAQHAETLMNGEASLFFIEDEQRAKTIFARKRITIPCRVMAVSRTERRASRLLDGFESRHGSTAKLLRTLPDFVLFELSPERATFVTGFGAAFDLTTSLRPLTEAAS